MNEFGGGPNNETTWSEAPTHQWIIVHENGPGEHGNVIESNRNLLNNSFSFWGTLNSCRMCINTHDETT